SDLISVPALVARGIRIVASDIGIPTSGHAVIARILPADIPAVYRRVGVVGYFDRSSEAATPLVSYRVLAGCVGCAGHCRHGECQHHTLSWPFEQGRAEHCFYRSIHDGFLKRATDLNQ